MEEQRRGWDWPHVFPRKLILAAWVAFHLIVAAAYWIQLFQTPEDPRWLILWKAIGGNSSGVWYWFVSWIYLNSEVATMILTLLSNRARVEKAAAEQYRIWAEWNRRREEAAAQGQPFTEPPPEPPRGYHRNGNGQGSGV